MSIQRRALPAFLLPCLLAPCLASAQQPYITARSKLLKLVRSGAARPGDTFLLRTATDWQQGDCAVTAGSAISGTVADLSAAASGPHRVVLGLRFDPVPCAGNDARELQPLLIAMQAPGKGDPDAQIRLETAQSEDEAVGALSVPKLSARSDPNQNPFANNATNAGAIVYDIQRSPREPAELKTGQVDGLGKITMQLPETTPVTHLLSPHEIVLQQNSDFVLRFVELPVAAEHTATDTLVARNAKPGAPSRKAEPDDVATTETCAASGCRELLASTDGTAGQAAWTLSLKSLGYSPRLRETIHAFGDTVTVHYLGTDQLLLTFPLHVLLHRGSVAVSPNLQRVRAVLLSAADGHVLQSREWTVPQAGPYLWPLGTGRVLAHIGDELVTYGPGLTAEQRFALPGPLAYASTAPEGDLVLATVLHERYTPQEHQRMASYLGPDVPVPEDYDLIGLNGTLGVISKRLSHVEPPKPALTSSGIVAVERRKVDAWDIVAISLVGARKRLTAVRSTCGVELTSLTGGLTLVRSCTGSRDTAAYRVLNATGATLLRGEAAYGDLFQQAATDANATKIAIVTSHFDSPADLRQGLQAGDFKTLSVHVYRTGDGKQIFAATPAAGSAEHQPLALAPAGDHLAVVTHDALQCYTLP